MRTTDISKAGVSATGLLVLLSVGGVVVGLWKLLAISWIAFAVMVGGAWWGARLSDSHARGLVWSYGLAAGAMITSDAVFLVPPAIGYDPTAGGFGVAGGLILGFVVHTAKHRLTHRSELNLAPAVVEVTAHALAAGLVIGLVYASMPSLGLLLGLAIVSHKGPAGWAVAHRLARSGRSADVLLAPASAVGLTALPAGLLTLPVIPLLNALVFGFAAGIFLHMAMDFLPRCEMGGEIYNAIGLKADPSSDAHRRLDRLRLHAAASTALGGAIVLVLWFLVGL